ncbi:MAG: ATP-binding cassette domain-containing protein, partial [Alphaproteobacteria bacterium]
MPLLEVRDIVVRFGGVTAVAGVSFDVEEGQICGLIGPNGAGKTTLFNVISGIYRPNEGSVRFDGKITTQEPRHRMAPLGLGRTFQNLALFKSMTVHENILAGAHSAGRAGFLANA